MNRKYRNYTISSRDLQIFSDKGFVNTENDQLMGGSHWCAFFVKNNKSFYLDNMGAGPDKFLLNQLP